MDKWLDGELYVTLAHSMEKEHFVSFAALISFERVQLVKLYPEQEPAVRFAGGLLRMRRLFFTPPSAAAYIGGERGREGWHFMNGEWTYPAIRGW